jgi:hypothetical protein
MIADPPHAFAARTLSLSRIGDTRSAGERAAWRQGFVFGAATVVSGAIGLALLLVLVQPL